VEVDVRIMAATNRDLTAEIAAKRFRADLYYRLGVVSLEVPPLRERREDIPDLVDYYCEHFVQRLRRPVAKVTGEAMRMLVSYDWPGNVRELINVMEHATLLCQDDLIGPLDLPEIGLAAASGAVCGDRLELSTVGWPQKPWSEVRDSLLRAGERHYLEALLRETAGRINVAAARAGLSVRSLSRKMRRTGLRKEAFRRPRVVR
jgi:DNA-binding NtrC family response regulator